MDSITFDQVLLEIAKHYDADTDAIKKKLYPFVEQKLNTTAGKRAYMNCISRFIQKRYSDLYDNLPCSRIIFTEEDANDLFKSLEIPKELVTGYIQETYYGNETNFSPKAAKDEFTVLMMTIVRYFMTKNMTKEFELALIHLSFSGKFYPSLHYRSYPVTVPVRHVMEYTVNERLNSKFELISQGNVIGAIKKIAQTWANTYKQRFKTFEDEDVVYCIQQLYSRIGSFMKNIATEYYKVYDDNIAVVSGLFSRLNNLFYIKLKDLESDFIPKLLINEFFSSNGETDKKYTNIIIGNDKDFGQMLYEPNVFQIVKLATEKRFELRTSWNVLEKFVKTPFTEDCVLRNPKFIPLMLAIAGDEADSIFGISKVANKTIYKYLNRLYKDKIIDDNDYDVELFYNKIENYKKINANYLNDLTTHKLISEKDRMIDNYKLTSFDKVLEWLKNDSKKKIIAQLDKVSSNDEQRNTLLSKLCLNRKSFDFLI